MVDHNIEVLAIEIATGFAEALRYSGSSDNRDQYFAAIQDDIVIVGEAFQKHFPDFNINEFYYKCGYHNQKKYLD